MKGIKSILIILIIIISIIIVRYITFNPFKPNSGNFDNNKSFVDNQVNVFFYDNVSFNQIKLFLMRINGKLDTDEESIINSYAITLNKTFEKEEDVEKYCNKLMDKYDIIEDCSLNEITRIDDPFIQ